MANNAPIGVFDSGIGGLTVVKEIMSLMPGESIVYFGDTARTPYGSRSPAEIVEFMHQILRFLKVQNIKIAVMACNTMTACGLEIAQKQYPFPVVGVNTGVHTALRISKNKNIGVIATQATIAGGKHGKAVKDADSGAVIYPQACPKFVPLIEQEHIEGALIEDAALEYLTPIRDAGVETLILGCTHYPYISPLIRRIMGKDVDLVDPARDTVLDAYNILAKADMLADNKAGTIRLCFSADLERVRRLAKVILGEPLPDIELVNLQDFT